MKSLMVLTLVLFTFQSYPPAFPREGITKLFENERVIVWTGLFPQGKPTAMHEHKLPHVGVFLSAGRVRGTLLDGTTGVATVSKGAVTWGPAGRIHVEESLEAGTRAIGIELKEFRPRAQALKTPPNAKVVFENERVVAWDIAWASQVSASHTHDHDYVIVPLDEGDVRYTLADGTARVESYTPGEAIYVKAGELRSTVATKGNPRAILVALK
jgi:quercetin dioxygenase-like cupin family protein